MKYSPSLYARAFAEVAVKPLSAAEEKRAIENFLAFIRKNGDWGAIGKILATTEKILREKTGRRKFVFETARPLGKLLERLRKELTKSHDVVEEKLNPSLIAGVKITMNDEIEFDGSLQHKLDKLFST